MTTKAIEAGARAIKELPLHTFSDTTAKKMAAACIEAAIASGELVPASAVTAERERCAKVAEREAEFWQDAESSSAHIAAAAIRALEPASGEYVLVPRAPTQAMIEAGCEANPTQWNEGTDLGFAADVANDVYSAMLTAAASNGSGK